MNAAHELPQKRGFDQVQPPESAGLVNLLKTLQAVLEPMQVEAMAGCGKDKTCTTSRSGRAVQVLTS
jgi:hypothetical protein